MTAASYLETLGATAALAVAIIIAVVLILAFLYALEDSSIIRCVASIAAMIVFVATIAWIGTLYR